MDREVSETYLAQQVALASPAKLVAMLYDRAIVLLRDAVAAIEAGNIERRWKANSQAMEIIGELWQALDLERGGEIASNLNQLYGFMTRRLSAVDLENDAQAARDVIRLLEPLRASWHEIANQKEPKSQNGNSPDNGAPAQVFLSA